ncbi:mitochondrial cardiolipin hydrolase isoform X2 [Phyllopteryx taeniolatus]|uniref:mitochondrial cardiolipin hydrolase isoform X2 n=1 Tax=Phyllopteryx taeniolatus TaxID=161469 RepID=UPI002AD55C82|nr:mitochondrial cardiolipin hydrolase isoform X2 [Phyllopteryx taeniolatus]
MSVTQLAVTRWCCRVMTSAATGMSVMWTVKVVGLGAVAFSLSVELLWRLLRHLRPPTVLNEVLFFPSNVACMEHIFSPASPHSCCCPLPHGVQTSFTRLLRFILSATSSLDLCLFSFSNMDLSRAVLHLYRKKVAVRVLVDEQYSVISGSQVGALRKAGRFIHNAVKWRHPSLSPCSSSSSAGICVRNVGLYVHMHHKFALVDGRRLITGSLNWTLAAVQCNAENILVTEEPRLVRPFVGEFRRLWADNDPCQNGPSCDRNVARN